MVEMVELSKAGSLFGAVIPQRRLKYWAYCGVLGPTGDRVKLRTVKIGGRRFVRAEDAKAFLEATSGPEPPIAPKRTRREEAEAQRRYEDARQKVYGS